MPPGQPIHRCFECDRLRPTKPHWGVWLCFECAPKLTTTPPTPDAGGKTVATDGGSE